MVFAGGSRMSDPCDTEDASTVFGSNSANTPPSITIMRGKRLAVMQMDYDWIDFVALCKSPYLGESCDPYAVAVLLQKDLVLLDLLTPGYVFLLLPQKRNMFTASCCILAELKILTCS
ncbi:unnamed protein product [Schistocephalus solidus]|uniref:Lethal giant larvae homologue 2 domain-containing protein n=1 Tax=Schistocephalus solidus TaxID=70667 RepID=A0A3P7DNN4_SCHSO|nr:unnamed protein product [Schistocephalus solidus]